MIKLTTVIQKFEKKGEKTGWSYVCIAASQSERLNPGCRVSYRVKGYVDKFPIKATALLPMGDGDFIIPLKTEIRKKIGKERGDKVTLQLEMDSKPLKISSDLIVCLKQEPGAFANFKALPQSHQNYFSKWIESAKTIDTKTRRITMTVVAMANKLSYAEMLRAYRDGSL